MKKFNWTEARRLNHPETLTLLKESYDKPISEHEYIQQWLALPHNHLKTTVKRPAKEYQYLKTKFGFFRSTK